MELWTIYFVLFIGRNYDPVHFQENFWSREECASRYAEIEQDHSLKLGNDSLQIGYTPCVRR